MKHTIVYHITSSYVNGGASGTYHYKITTNKITNTAGNSWRMRVFKVKRPATTIIITAWQQTNGAGGPPAFAGRTLTITSAGVFSFVDANETIATVTAELVLSDVEEGAYENISAAVLESGGLSTATIGGVDCLSTFVPVTYCADTNTFIVTFGISATLLAIKTLPTLALVIAETALVTREYTGSYAELTAKAIVTMAQVLNQRYEGAVAQAVAYARSGNSPMSLSLVAVLHEWAMGVLQ